MIGFFAMCPKNHAGCCIFATHAAYSHHVCRPTVLKNPLSLPPPTTTSCHRQFLVPPYLPAAQPHRSAPLPPSTSPDAILPCQFCPPSNPSHRHSSGPWPSPPLGSTNSEAYARGPPATTRPKSQRTTCRSGLARSHSAQSRAWLQRFHVEIGSSCGWLNFPEIKSQEEAEMLAP
jgi:hypothetical protein